MIDLFKRLSFYLAKDKLLNQKNKLWLDEKLN